MGGKNENERVASLESTYIPIHQKEDYPFYKSVYQLTGDNS